MANKKDTELVQEAKDRFERCQKWEAKARENFIYDMKFSQGDSSNMWQWPEVLAKSRSASDLPCLTVNKVRQCCLQIINDQRQNESSIEVRPTGNGATFEAAQIYEGIVRHIEYASNAQAAYDNSTFSQVTAGIGYWRITTDYENDTSFNQVIKIVRVPDPLSIYLDPDIQEFDGSDAKFGFVFRDMSKDEYDSIYGDADDVQQDSPLGVGSSDGWMDDDHIRVCEYFRVIDKDDYLHVLPDGSTVKESDAKKLELAANRHESFDGETHTDTLKRISQGKRPITSPKIEWYLIAGNDIKDRKDWLGKYIPIVRNIGEETVIDKVMDRKGHTRALIDPQRMYNYWTSSAVEHVALQSKTPYVAAVESIEGYQEEWRNANLENLAVLPYNAMRDDGTPLPKPEREAPPQMAQAYMEGLKITQNELMVASGQYEATFGQPSNEISGKAIQERERGGDRSTYHYVDHFSQAIRFTGRILIDLIPKIYDIPRIQQILGQDGTQTAVQIDPNAPQAHQQQQDPDDPNYNPEQIAVIFNPNVGDYAVEADIGPSFSTRRQETFSALTQIIQSSPTLLPVVGDLLFKAADFPLADEIGERLKNLVPPEAMGQSNPQVTQLQQQLAAQHQLMQKQGNELLQAKSKQAVDDTQKQIDWYEAETRRMTAVSKIDPDALMPIVRQLVSQVLGMPINPLIAAHKAQNAVMAQPPEAPPSPVLPPQPPEPVNAPSS